jgi:hypothetical protein
MGVGPFECASDLASRLTLRWSAPLLKRLKNEGAHSFEALLFFVSFSRSADRLTSSVTLLDLQVQVPLSRRLRVLPELHLC